MSDQKVEQYNSLLAFKVKHRWKEGNFPTGADYLERIEYELGIVRQMNYSSYFLIISDLCDFMRTKGIMYVARGSGCGSILIWALGVSHRWIDPIEYGLPFERFLNPNRVSLPDIDIDIQDDRRDEVVEYTIQKYGREYVAKIVTFGTMAAKVAIKDSFRGLAIPDYDKIANEITLYIPGGKGSDGKNIRLEDAIKESEALQDFERKYPEPFRLAKRIEGKIRNASRHAAGTIITPQKVTKYMPVVFWGNPADREPDEWFPTCQFDMYDCEDRGHLKMDYLGLKTLRVISNTCKAINIIKRLRGEPADFNIDNIDRRDPKTFRMLADGKLACVFQVEKQFVRNFAKRMGLQRCDPWQLAILISIIRPGMMDTGATEEYLRRGNGESAITVLDPLLEKTLEKNFGLFVFQEDCMWAAVDMAGLTLAMADELRRAISKKKPKDMAKIKPEFVKGSIAKGATEERAEKVWHNMETFGRYGFNNAHAAAYGLVILYMTGYLKTHWSLPFMQQMVNSESGTTSKEDGYNYKVAEYIEEARSMGITIQPPCVKRSADVCSITVNENAIRFGLSLIKKVSYNAVEWTIKHARKAESFKDFVMAGYDFRQNDKGDWKPYSEIAKGDFEGLIMSGAMDIYENGDRTKMMAMLPKVMDLAHKYWEQLGKQKVGRKVRITAEDVMAELESYTIDEDSYDQVTLEHRLQQEQEVTGCYLSESPFQPYQQVISTYCQCSPDDILNGLVHDDQMVFAGIMSKMTETVVKKGKNAGSPMGFLGFTGINGSSIECTVFTQAWARITNAEANKWVLEKGKVYLVSLKRDRDNRGYILNDLRRLSNCGFDQV